VDDYSTDEDSAKKNIYGFMLDNFPKLLAKTKQIVTNEEMLFSAGNQFMRVKEFCYDNAVVVSLNPNSSIIGKQLLKVVNAIYQDPNTWVALFPALTSIWPQDGKPEIIKKMAFQINSELRFS
jgi:hypothetical protein